MGRRTGGARVRVEKKGRRVPPREGRGGTTHRRASTRAASRGGCTRRRGGTRRRSAAARGTTRTPPARAREARPGLRRDAAGARSRPTRGGGATSGPERVGGGRERARWRSRPRDPRDARAREDAPEARSRSALPKRAPEAPEARLRSERAERQEGPADEAARISRERANEPGRISSFDRRVERRVTAAGRQPAAPRQIFSSDRPGADRSRARARVSDGVARGRPAPPPRRARPSPVPRHLCPGGGPSARRPTAVPPRAPRRPRRPRHRARGLAPSP